MPIAPKSESAHTRYIMDNETKVAIEKDEQDIADLVNTRHPMRDFGAQEQGGFRTTADFDARFGVRA